MYNRTSTQWLSNPLTTQSSPPSLLPLFLPDSPIPWQADPETAGIVGARNLVVVCFLVRLRQLMRTWVIRRGSPPSLGLASGHHVDATHLHMHWAVVTRMETDTHTVLEVSCGLGPGISSTRNNRYPMTMDEWSTHIQTAYKTHPSPHTPDCGRAAQADTLYAL